MSQNLTLTAGELCCCKFEVELSQNVTLTAGELCCYKIGVEVSQNVTLTFEELCCSKLEDSEPVEADMPGVPWHTQYFAPCLIGEPLLTRNICINIM